MRDLAANTIDVIAEETDGVLVELVKQSAFPGKKCLYVHMCGVTILRIGNLENKQVDLTWDKS